MLLHVPFRAARTCTLIIQESQMDITNVIIATAALHLSIFLNTSIQAPSAPRLGFVMMEGTKDAAAEGHAKAFADMSQYLNKQADIATGQHVHVAKPLEASVYQSNSLLGQQAQASLVAACHDRKDWK